MLAKHPIDVMLMATDLEGARRFYGDRVGLNVLIESDDVGLGKVVSVAVCPSIHLPLRIGPTAGPDGLVLDRDDRGQAFRTRLTRHLRRALSSQVLLIFERPVSPHG
jgi:hypothetical protein